MQEEIRLFGAKARRYFGFLESTNRLSPTGAIGFVIALLSVVGTIATIYMALFGFFSMLIYVGVFITFAFPIIFLTTTVSNTVNRITWFDILLAIIGLCLGIWYILNVERFNDWMIGFDQMETADRVAGVLLIIMALEAVRRATGWPLLALATGFIVYTVMGGDGSGIFSHGGVSLDAFLESQLITQSGMFGTPLYVAATYAFLFILFGAFFERAGGGQMFFDIAAAATGRMRGGPAKSCVAASAMYGSISGSPVADVATTGPITIPVMMRTGLSAKHAAGIEAAASSGGALLPPVMGAVAFIMADFTGIPYHQIIIAGALSAILYYFGVFTMVHFQARLEGLGEMPDEYRVGLLRGLRSGWPNIVPIVVLTWYLVQGYSPAYVAAGSVLVVVLTSWIARTYAIGPRSLLDCCVETWHRVVPLAAAVAAAGIIVGCLYLTGAASKVSDLVLALAGGYLVPSLIASAVILMVLGMGMPTVAVYLMGAALLAPLLIAEFGLTTLQVHLFVLYFSCMSAITPPVAVACFTAAAIAGASPFAAAGVGFKLAIAGYILPFFFIFNSGLLLQGSPLEIAGSFVAAATMVFCVSLALHGWIISQRLSALTRLVFVGFGVLVIYPVAALQVAAVLAATAVYGGCYWRAQREHQKFIRKSTANSGVGG